MKEFKNTLRRTARLTMKDEDEWLIKASNVIKNNRIGVGTENRQPAVRGTIHLEEGKAEDVTRQILELQPRG